MPEPCYSSTLKNETTHTTTLHSGRNTGASRRPCGSSLSDPYKPVTDTLHALLTRKRNYYGCADDEPLANALAVEDQGIEPWVYQLARIGEKVRRCGGLRGTLDIRAIKETLMDIAGHATVAVALINHQENTHESEGT